MTDATVTAFVISHNHERYVEQCLRSIAEQTVRPDYLVVIDDGSQDASFEVAKAFAEDHFPDRQLIAHPRPIGLCRSLNEGLELSRGTYIAEISADDYWLPNKIESQLLLFEAADERTAVVYGDAIIVDADGTPTGEGFIERFAPEGPPSAEGLFIRLLTRGNFLPGMSAMIRRDRLLEVGGWDESLFYEDWDMWLRLSYKWHFERQPQAVAAYRLLNTSMSNAREHEMRLANLAIATKWAGHSSRADARMLRLTFKFAAWRAIHLDFRYLTSWLRLAAAAVARRLPGLSSTSQRPPVPR